MGKDCFEFDAKIMASEIGKGGAYVVVPLDIRTEYGKGRLKVLASFDGVSYEGSIVNMGLKHEEGSVCYVLGVRKDIRQALGKDVGDLLHVRIIPYHLAV